LKRSWSSKKWLCLLSGLDRSSLTNMICKHHKSMVVSVRYKQHNISESLNLSITRVCLEIMDRMMPRPIPGSFRHIPFPTKVPPQISRNRSRSIN
jgi:hypothetical protein